MQKIMRISAMPFSFFVMLISWKPELRAQLTVMTQHDGLPGCLGRGESAVRDQGNTASQLCVTAGGSPLFDDLEKEEMLHTHLVTGERGIATACCWAAGQLQRMQDLRKSHLHHASFTTG